MNMRRFWILSLLLLPALVARAQTLVNTWMDQQDVPAGAERSLREAVRDAQGGEVIQFDPKVFTGATGQVIRINAAWGRLSVRTNLAIDASTIPGGVEICGESRTGLLRVETNGTCHVQGLRFVEGKEILDNNGGAILNLGALRVERCWFARNEARVRGGAIFSAGTATLTHCVFEANRATSGAGLRNAGSLSASGCTFFDNFADGGYGGGLANEGSATLFNCTFTANIASYGAGLYNFSGPLRLHHCTVVSNIGVFAGGIYSGANTFYRSTIITANHGLNGEIDGGIIAQGVNLLGGAPRLSPLGDYGGWVPTMPPTPGSPVIDAASITPETPAQDARGAPRLRDAAPDLGAVEVLVPDPASRDEDGDGMDDLVEQLYGLDPALPDDALDADGDGSSNGDELGNFTNPRDGRDWLGIRNLTLFPDSNSGAGEVEVAWRSHPGLQYALVSQADLTEPGLQPGLPIIPAATGTNLITRARLSTEETGPRYIRVLRLPAAIQNRVQ